MSIVTKIPLSWIGIINRTSKTQVIINPVHKIYVGPNTYEVNKLNSKLLYNELIADKAILPRGLLVNWCHEMQLSDVEIKNAFTFAKLSTKNTFKQVFQYKINLYVLTNK